MMNKTLHTNSESKLLSAPLEVRRAIYAHFDSGPLHASLWEGRIRISRCLQPNLGDHQFDGHERRLIREITTTDREYQSQPIWARRLDSTWGHHWECEELALANEDAFDEGHMMRLAFVCKKMLMDVCDLLVEKSAFHITNLNMLNYHSPGLYLSDDAQARSCIWNYLRPRIQDLRITLRLPLAFYQAFEGHDVSDSELAQPEIEILSIMYDWNRFWFSVCNLKALRNLHVWLDHDHESSWSLVKERYVLLPVFDILAMRIKNASCHLGTPSFGVVFNLPKLHPNIAKPYSHFVSETKTQPFQVERRIRQRYHSQAPDQFSRVVKVAPDFPALWYLACEEGVPEESRVVFESLQLKDLEKLETILWSEGTDPVLWDRENRGYIGCH
ncbi:hypothetical protein VTL71DRAFT_3470 [Oculimacula yallundae]|uniref:DUF7730 domain-containing protein n=1 Tax=Oculimacula yallundae TaxID=86028 RepID=A0ABR4C7U7_9HELO